MKTLFAIYLVILGLLAYGYVENIIKLFHMASILSGEGAVRIIGACTGLGSIMGYF